MVHMVHMVSVCILFLSFIGFIMLMQVYFDFMRSFRTEFDDLFAEGIISAVEIGLGASGELKYPAFSERMGWGYPGIGEFQVSVLAYYVIPFLYLFMLIGR